MKFGHLKPDEAEDCILAHSVRLKETVLKKGTVLNQEAIRLLNASQVGSVMAARLEEGDVGEDEAAGRIARAIFGAHVTVDAPFTGRANIVSERAGVFVADEGRIKDLNRIDEAITVATLNPFSRVEKGQMVATVKIIPFSVPNKQVLELETITEERSRDISVSPFRGLNAGLILSRLPGDKDTVIEKRQRAVAERITALGGILEKITCCEHSKDAVVSAIGQAHRDGLELILLFGASAIVDRADVIPAALTRAGGEVLHLGMPVDPGNLLLYGKIAEVQVVGIPSCASSIKENGFDWVLERIFADLPLGREDFISMATGGLLKEIPSRPQPREGVAI